MNKKAAVIGHPIAQSLSPLIHNDWIAQYNMQGSYEALDVAPDALAEQIEKFKNQGYAGFNVTIPYKQAIMEYCRTIDETAQAIGAVNTVVIREDQTLHGINTDSFGFAENIRAAGLAEQLKSQKALVLGAGGAARGVMHALFALGLKEVCVVNRTKEKALSLAKDFPVQVRDWQERGLAARDCALLVNTTSLGMSGQPPLIFDLKYLPPQAAVCDIVYKPLYTELLKQAQQRGHKTVTGIGMLLHQARPAFKAWFGVMPEVTPELEKKILDVQS